MPAMVYVEHDASGAIVGVFANPQPGRTLQQMPADHPDVVAFRAGPPPTYRQLRAAAYRDRLGEEKGNYVTTLGDVLDDVIRELRAVRAGEPQTPEFAALCQQIDAIKAEHPKPEEDAQAGEPTP